MAHIGFVPGDQVVDRQHFPAAIEQIIAKMRSEKSRAACDYCAHHVGLIVGVLPIFPLAVFESAT